MNLHPFVNAVAALQFENCFNPYVDRCEIHDHPERLTGARRSCQLWWKVRRESRSTRSGLVEILGIAVDAGLALR